MDFLQYYLIIVNAIGLFIMPIDKENAKNGWQRVSEITLLTIAFLGGSLGMYVGMYIFKHKTKKPVFKIGVLFLVIFHISIFVFFP